jgi:hypothetical protein
MIGYYIKASGKSVEKYTNIYTSNFTEQAQKMIQEELDKRYTESVNPKFTGVYNPIVSSYGGEALERDTNQLQKQYNDIRYKNTKDPSRDIKGGDISRDTKKVILPAKDGDFFTFKGDSEGISSATGLPIELNPDTQPFFSKLTQNVEKFDSSRLDHALGNSLSFLKKDAVERFTDGYTVSNANMSQVIYTDHVDKDRFIPSIYHQGIPVIQPELIAKPKEGTFENDIQIRGTQRTLEELRPVQTKASYTFEPVPGTNPVNHERAEFGDVTKDKLKTFRENTFDDFYRGPGGYTAKKSDELYNVKDTNKVYYSDRTGGLKGYDNPESRFGNDGFRPVMKESYTPTTSNLTGDRLAMKGDLTDYSSVGTHRETLEKTPMGNPNKNSKGNVLHQESTQRTLREDLSGTPLANPTGPFTGSLNKSRDSGLVNFNAKTTTKEIGLKGYIGGMKKDQYGNYLTESYDPKTTLKELILQRDRVGIAADVNKKGISYEGNENYQNEKAEIKESLMSNRTPNKSSNLGNGDITLNNVTLKEYINRPAPLYYNGSSIITGVDNIGTVTTRNKVIGSVDRLQPIKSNILQDYNRIESS